MKTRKRFSGPPCVHYPDRFKTEAAHEGKKECQHRYEEKCRARRSRREFEAHTYPLTLRLQRILANINYRCRNRERYAGRGIRNFLTFADLLFLWQRDNAESMQRPSIDRRDNDGDYTVENCRFLELFENISLGTQVREAKRFGVTVEELRSKPEERAV